MTEGPPPSAASSSKLPPTTETSTPTQSQAPGPSPSFAATSNANQPLPQAYSNYTTWNSLWPSAYSGYSPASANASQTPYAANPYAAHLFQSHSFSAPQFTKSTRTKPNTNQSVKPPSPAHPPAPVLPEPETYKDWDEVIRKFLVKSKMTQTLKGFEDDMLILSPKWEQKVIPDALKEMVLGLQPILDRISGKQEVKGVSTQVEPDVDITTITDPLGGRPLEERKLDYAHLSLGVERRSPSSINKSISQFLARTRARNDASNRSEFLYTLAEKKRRLAQSRPESEGRDDAYQNGLPEHEIVSCARVDAKPIDRDKQVKYDIAKYGEGPLTKTVKSGQESAPQTDSSVGLLGSALSEPPATLTTRIPISSGSEAAPRSKRKRKLDEIDGIEEPQIKAQPTSVRKGKGKAKEEAQNARSSVQDKDSERDGEETALALATAARHPGIDDRLKNLEEHLAIRYVPTPPRTLMARLKFLEDHVIKLEKEYPPWAALHFKQPHRGWPPPPRATPVIVPPHARSVTSSSSAPFNANPHPTLSNATSTSNIPAPTLTSQDAGPSTNVKPRKTNSSLQKAVLERLEVRKAMGEMGGKGDLTD